MPPGLPASRLLRRLAAGCYDLLIVAGILMLTSLVVIIARRGGAVPAGNVAYRAFLAAQAAAYFIGFWCHGGQTPGMRTWRIRVQLVQGGPLSIAVAALRFAAAVLSAAPAGIGFLWMLVDPECRTWHDRLSGTRVVSLSGPRDKRAAP
jgi:uncharacterized RDD family membrane protein YckC